MGKMSQAKDLAGHSAKWILTVYSTVVLLFIGYSLFELITDEVTAVIALIGALPQLVIIYSFRPDRFRRKKTADVRTEHLIVQKEPEFKPDAPTTEPSNS